MPKLGEIQFYKHIIGNREEVEAIPWAGNVPEGLSPITREAFERIGKQRFNNEGKSIFQVAEESGKLKKGFIDPAFKKFKPNAPRPTEEFFTDEFKAQVAKEREGMINIGTEETPLFVPPGTERPQPGITPGDTLGAAGFESTGQKKEVGSFPQSSDEYDQWIAMGRTIENGVWVEPAGVGQDSREGDIRQKPDGTLEMYNPFGEWAPISIDNANFQLEQGGRVVGDINPDTITDTGDTGGTGDTSQTGDPGLDALLDVMQKMLDDLTARGQMINPDLTITPEETAKFMAQAEREIDPFFSGQLKLARDSFLSELGFSKEDIVKKEAEYERLYGKALRTLGEQAAETGFATSGRRLVAEQELAEETQRGIGETRTLAARGAERAGRSFAELFGGASLPGINIPGAPTVTAGQRKFTPGAGAAPLFDLTGSAFKDVIGEREFERRTAVRTRTSELEGAHRRSLELSARRQFI